MKYKIGGKFIKASVLLVFALLSFSCQKQIATQTAGAQTPTEAFKMLFDAVKAKDTERIKQMMSKATLNFAEGYAQQTKQTVEKALENGFTAPTLAASLPEIRDERVKDNFGAIEVYDQKNKRWEDLPFVKEDEGWKLAVGDVFKGTYKSPGKAKSQFEPNAANTFGSNAVRDAESNFNATPQEGNKSLEVPSESKSRR